MAQSTYFPLKMWEQEHSKGRQALIKEQPRRTNTKPCSITCLMGFFVALSGLQWVLAASSLHSDLCSAACVYFVLGWLYSVPEAFAGKHPIFLASSISWDLHWNISFLFQAECTAHAGASCKESVSARHSTRLQQLSQI